MTVVQQRYSRTAMMLHWSLALLIIFAFGLGQRTEDLPRGASLFAVFQLHKSIGITILALSLWRLGLRIWGNHPPALETGLTAWLAKAVHWLFYAIMIGAPMTGWLLVSTAKTKIPTLLFGVIPLPHLPVSGEAVHGIAEEVHKLLSVPGIPLLLLLHVAGAIRHQVLLKEPLVERMVPSRKAGLGTIVAMFAVLAATFSLGKFAPIAETISGTLPMPSAVPIPIAPVPTVETNETAPTTVQEGNESAAMADETEGDEAPVVSRNWTIMPGGSLGFTVTVSGQTVQGSFKRWNAEIELDPEDTKDGRIAATIDLASVGSGDAERDGMLAGSDFFATSAHPRASFSARDIRKLGGNRFEARGTLTLKGVSRPLRLPFTLDIDGDRARAKGRASFDRRSFKVGEGQFEGTEEVGGDVRVSLDFRARRKPAPQP
jgi:cytochrome b561/polyisoprenoid-binding protein YceI